MGELRTFGETIGRYLLLAAFLFTFLNPSICSATPSDKLTKSTPEGGFRGVFFNPNIKHRFSAGYPWPVFDPYDGEYRDQIRSALRDLVSEADINLIALFVPIPFTLAHPPEAPQIGQQINDWANTRYLDNLAVFIDDCHDAGILVEIDLADNRWIPYSIDSEHHIGRPGNPTWPVADETPWEESAIWYTQMIDYIESHTKHPESIAMWCMMGNYQLGTCEPCLWNRGDNPAITSSTERFVKEVWPAFRSAGTRPKAAPYMLPIFSNSAYWDGEPPEERLSGFSNLKKWLVDDLALPPDYWPMTTYSYSDPAPDGVHYLRRIVKILGKENASRIISTDFKGPGHDQELNDSIISSGTHSGSDMIQWNLEKCAEYGFAGWWVYSYQDQEVFEQRTGIRSLDGQWKTDLLPSLKWRAN
ncbi:MAG: hypothetical protein KC978_15580 [Candidatus Omnitrophica bacterium]|nr:hypothetical protein [Candidatus Omnitrophota bacterium]